MTRRLYYEDAYCRRFDATVEALEVLDGRTHLRLNATAFYPEGGGQPSDRGYIGGGAVSYVYEKRGEVWHVAEGSFAVGRAVHGELNWGRRFHYMQQHLGQHILSAVFRRDFGAETVGVRFGVELSTLDLGTAPTDAQIAEAELLANDIIYKNLEVEAQLLGADEAATLDADALRKLPDGAGALRRVVIAGFDSHLCCGVHNRATGEVGLIKLFRAEPYKGGVRVGFACGGAAFTHYRRLCEDFARIRRALSSPEAEAAERVEKLCEENAALKKERQSMTERLLAGEAEKMVGEAISVGPYKVVSETLFSTTQADLHGLFEQLTREPGVVAILGGTVPGGAALVFGTHKADPLVDVRDVFAQSLEFIGGKGGGGATACRGMGADASRLSEVVEAAGQVMLQRLLQLQGRGEAR